MARRSSGDFEEYPTWSNARFWQFIRSALRSAFMSWPPKYELIKENQRTLTPKQRARKGARHTYECKCNKCKKWFKKTEVEVDHIEPVGSLKSLEDLPGFVSRMFVGKERLRLLCKPCHRKVTEEARKR